MRMNKRKLMRGLLLVGVLLAVDTVRAGEPFYKEDSVTVLAGQTAATSSVFKVVSFGVGRERWNGAVLVQARNASVSTGAVSFVATSVGVNTTIATTAYLTNSVNNTDSVWPVKLRIGTGYTNSVPYPVREMFVVVTLQGTNSVPCEYEYSFFGE